MNMESLRSYCLAKKHVTESFPFDSDTLVFKVGGKMFALTSLSRQPFSINLKMDEALVPEWRDRYDDVQPGYHMNKKMWNTVCAGNNSISDKELKWLIDHSYEEVLKKMSRKKREELLKGL